MGARCCKQAVQRAVLRREPKLVVLLYSWDRWPCWACAETGPIHHKMTVDPAYLQQLVQEVTKFATHLRIVCLCACLCVRSNTRSRTYVRDSRACATNVYMSFIKERNHSYTTYVYYARFWAHYLWLSHNSPCTLAQTINSSKPATKFSMFMLLPFYGNESQRVGERDMQMAIRGFGTMQSFERGNLLICLIPFCLPICTSRLMSRGLHQQSSHHTFFAHIRNRGWSPPKNGMLSLSFCLYPFLSLILARPSRMHLLCKRIFKKTSNPLHSCRESRRIFKPKATWS
jgi:hypothetical protein